MSSQPNAGQIRHLLVVEDSTIIALEIEMSVQELGVQRVSVVASIAAATELIAEGGIDAALVDMLLGEEDGAEVARQLFDQGIPFAIMSGLQDLANMEQRFPHAPLLSKPFSRHDLVATLERLAADPQ